MLATAHAPDLFAIWQLNMALLDAHNRARASEGRRPLRIQWNLAAAACAWSDRMAGGLGLNHFGPDGSTPWTRIPAAGYPLPDPSIASENVAEASPGVSVDDVMSLWMASPGHRANVLGDWLECGFGHATADDGTTYYTADFGRGGPATSGVPRDAAKSPSGADDPGPAGC